MQAGKLRHRIQIQSATETNTNGQVTRVWSTVATVWGEISTLGGRELYRAQQVVPEAKYSARMRYRSGVTPEMRLRKVTTVDGELTVNLTLNILNVADADARGIELFCLCTEADQ